MDILYTLFLVGICTVHAVLILYIISHALIERADAYLSEAHRLVIESDPDDWLEARILDDKAYRLYKWAHVIAPFYRLKAFRTFREFFNG